VQVDLHLVSDRNRVVAELHEPNPMYVLDGAPNPLDPQLASWIDSGVVVPPTVSKSNLPVSPVRLDEGIAQRLLDDDRNETER